MNAIHSPAMRNIFLIATYFCAVPPAFSPRGGWCFYSPCVTLLDHSGLRRSILWVSPHSTAASCHVRLWPSEHLQNFSNLLCAGGFSYLTILQLSSIVICLLRMSSAVALLEYACLIAQELAALQELECGSLYEWKPLPVLLLIISILKFYMKDRDQFYTWLWTVKKNQ